MAYLTIARIDGEPEALLAAYTRTADEMAAVGRDHGLIVHAAAGTDDGIFMVNLWGDEEGSAAAARDPRRLAVLAGHGLRPDQIRKEHHVVANHVVFG